MRSPTSPDQQLAPHLDPGERLLWCGRPDPSKVFTDADFFLVPFSLLWGGIMILGAGGAALAGEGSAWFALPFVAAGCYFIAGRFVYKVRRNRRTAYGITDRRALVAVGDRALNATPIRGTATAIRRRRSRRHVSVTFGTRPFWSGPAFYGNTGMEFFDLGGTAVAFYDVAEPEALLVALQAAACAGSPAEPSH